MKFKPISMRTPNKDFIYAPSKLRPSVEANGIKSLGTGRLVKVSFEDDGVSNPQVVSAVSLPEVIETESGDIDIWPGWYVAAGKDD